MTTEHTHTVNGPHYDTVGHDPTRCVWDVPHCGPCWIRGEPKPQSPWTYEASSPADTGCPAAWDGGHALVIESGDGMITARCECGEPFGRGTPATSLDHFGQVWEYHMATREG